MTFSTKLQSKFLKAEHNLEHNQDQDQLFINHIEPATDEPHIKLTPKNEVTLSPLRTILSDAQLIIKTHIFYRALKSWNTLKSQLKTYQSVRAKKTNVTYLEKELAHLLSNFKYTIHISKTASSNINSTLNREITINNQVQILNLFEQLAQSTQLLTPKTELQTINILFDQQKMKKESKKLKNHLKIEIKDKLDQKHKDKIIDAYVNVFEKLQFESASSFIDIQTNYNTNTIKTIISLVFTNIYEKNLNKNPNKEDTTPPIFIDKERLQQL